MATHPLVATGQRYIASGLALGAVGVGLGLAMGSIQGAGCITLVGLCGGFLVWNGRALRTSGIALPIVRASTVFIMKGDLDAAERVPDTLPPAIAKRPMVARVIANQRALIALMRGDTKKAAALATESLAIPGGFFTRDWDAARRAESRATRALARAALGEDAGVDEDVRAIEASPLATSGAIARAELARAIVFARSGDRAALGEHLRKHASHILENVMPRERTLARALRRLALAPGKSIYREPMRPTDEETEAGGVRSWIREVAPDAAEFAPREVFVAAELPPPEADPAAMRSIASARASAAAAGRRGQWKLTLVLWVVLVGLFCVLYQWLDPAADMRPVTATAAAAGAAPSVFGPLAAIGGIGALLVGAFGLWLRRYRRQQARLSLAARAIALGDEAAGASQLQALGKSSFPVLAASARRELAMLANRKGRFLDTLTETDAGLAFCNRNATIRALTGDAVGPGLLAERAVALAAMDRHVEAETELANLTHGFPNYMLVEQASFRVRLVMAVRRGDTETAARIALARRPEMPLDLKIDLLADVALAASGEPMSVEERDRIALELRAMPEVNAWIERVAGDYGKRGPRAEAPTAEAMPDEQDGEELAAEVRAL